MQMMCNFWITPDGTTSRPIRCTSNKTVTACPAGTEMYATADDPMNNVCGIAR